MKKEHKENVNQIYILLRGGNMKDLELFQLIEEMKQDEDWEEFDIEELGEILDYIGLDLLEED